MSRFIIDKEVYEDALVTVKLSKVVYNDSCARLLRSEGFKNVKFIDDNGAQVVCATKDKNAYIAFRGTQPDKLNDITADLKFWKDQSEASNKAQVHEGFQTEVDKVQDDIEAWMKKIKYKSLYKKYILTGHSLGAAMATVFASRLGSDKVDGLFTYGSPRVGGAKFQTLLDNNIKHYRFVNNNDVVTRIPPSWAFYSHTGECVYYDHLDNCYQNPGFWKKTECFWTGTWHAIKKGNFFDFVADHSIDKYVELVDNSLIDN